MGLKDLVIQTKNGWCFKGGFKEELQRLSLNRVPEIWDDQEDSQLATEYEFWMRRWVHFCHWAIRNYCPVQTNEQRAKQIEDWAAPDLATPTAVMQLYYELKEVVEHNTPDRQTAQVMEESMRRVVGKEPVWGKSLVAAYDNKITKIERAKSTENWSLSWEEVESIWREIQEEFQQGTLLYIIRPDVQSSKQPDTTKGEGGLRRHHKVHAGIREEPKPSLTPIEIAKLTCSRCGLRHSINNAQCRRITNGKFDPLGFVSETPRNIERNRIYNFWLSRLNKYSQPWSQLPTAQKEEFQAAFRDLTSRWDGGSALHTTFIGGERKKSNSIASSVSSTPQVHWADSDDDSSFSTLDDSIPAHSTDSLSGSRSTKSKSKPKRKVHAAQKVRYLVHTVTPRDESQDTLSMFRVLYDTVDETGKPVQRVGWHQVDHGSMESLIDEECAALLNLKRVRIPKRDRYIIRGIGSQDIAVSWRACLTYTVTAQRVLPVAVLPGEAPLLNNAREQVQLKAWIPIIPNCSMNVIFGGHALRRIKMIDLFDHKLLLFQTNGIQYAMPQFNWNETVTQMASAQDPVVQKCVARHLRENKPQPHKAAVCISKHIPPHSKMRIPVQVGKGAPLGGWIQTLPEVARINSGDDANEPVLQFEDAICTANRPYIWASNHTDDWIHLPGRPRLVVRLQPILLGMQVHNQETVESAMNGSVETEDTAIMPTDDKFQHSDISMLSEENHENVTRLVSSSK